MPAVISYIGSIIVDVRQWAFLGDGDLGTVQILEFLFRRLIMSPFAVLAISLLSE